MNLEELKNSDRIIFECVSGSILYNLSTPKSDIDIRGFFINPQDEYLGLNEPSGQIGDEKHDVTYYSLKRAFELLQTANPNSIELLYPFSDCIKLIKPAMEELIKNRSLFISKKCYHTHSGYAYAQIQRARGSNKKVHNPQPEEMPKKEDFCLVISNFNGSINLKESLEIDVSRSHFPCRPIKLRDSGINLSDCHVASLEYTKDVYRLYRYNSGAKGVFRGNDMLVCESIPISEEFNNFVGLLIYNQELYEKAVKEWHSYWDWVKNRNESRWLDQEKGLVEYDSKNLMHCMRLLISGESILTNGYPLVRFEGEQREYLMKIRRGEFEYEEIMAEVEKRMENLKKLYETSTIPYSVDVNKIEELYRYLATSGF